MKPQSQKYNSWDKLVIKTVAIEAKAYLKLFYYSRNMDNSCLKDNSPSYIILLQPQKNCDEFLDKT